MHRSICNLNILVFPGHLNFLIFCDQISLPLVQKDFHFKAQWMGKCPTPGPFFYLFNWARLFQNNNNMLIIKVPVIYVDSVDKSGSDSEPILTFIV